MFRVPRSPSPRSLRRPNRLKILFLSQRVPYPPNRGDKITTWRLVERFARKHEVEVLAFAHDETDLAAAEVLTREKGIPTFTVPHDDRRKRLTSLPLLLTRKPLTLGVYGSRALQAEVDRRLDSADLAYAYSSSMGAFLLGRGLPWVMHIAELDSDKWRQYAEKHRFPMNAVYRREYRTLRRFEDRIARDSVTNVFCTPLEQEIFQKAIPGAPSIVVRNGVDLGVHRRNGLLPERRRVRVVRAGDPALDTAHIARGTVHHHRLTAHAGSPGPG
jgi:hypothetical protein